MLTRLCAVLAIQILVVPAAVSSGSEAGPAPRPPAFTVVPLGVAGGAVDGNLSAYLVGAAGADTYACLDAGTVLGGLQKAVEAGAFPAQPSAAASSLATAAAILRDQVKAYLISHAHFDHTMGLVIVSPDDSRKPIMALPATVDALRDHVFNHVVWSNFADEGALPHLGRYHYVRLVPGQPAPIPGTGLEVRAMPLSHGGPTGSSAFLVSHAGQHLVYFGDVGPDQLAGDDRLDTVWRLLAPLVRAGSLRGLLLECSWPDPRDPAQLYGHLTPSWFLAELGRLAALVDPAAPATALAGLRVVVTHVKPSLAPGEPADVVVRRQLDDGNQLGLDLVVARQGARLDL